MLKIKHRPIAVYYTPRDTRVAGLVAKMVPSEDREGYNITIMVKNIQTEEGKYYSSIELVDGHSSWINIEDGREWTDEQINFELYLALGYVPEVYDDSKRTTSRV